MSREPTDHLRFDPGDEDDFFQTIRGRMSERGRTIVETLERVKAVYVECGRDTVLEQSFEKFLQQYLAKRNGVLDEAPVFFVTGESGAGKSAAVARLLRNQPILQPLPASYGRVSPYVSVKLSGFTHPRIAGRRIVQASGYPLAQKSQRGEIWDSMAGYLRTRKVFLVHVDETQHLIKDNASQQEREDLVNAIKGVAIDAQWPVAFLLSGLPRLTKLPLQDEQFERRGNYVHFPDVNMPGERTLVQRIMRRLGKAAGLEIGGLTDTDLPDRIAHAARYRYARICQVVVAAIHEALSEENPRGSLLRDHFALAYAHHSHARGNNDRNPFIVDGWSRLKRGSFLIEDPERAVA